MLNQAADQICALLARMLAHIRAGRASTDSVRAMLKACKAVNAQLAALQVAAAAYVARCEGHRDGGAGALRSSTGVSARQARRDIDTSESLGRIPAVREAVEEGEITFANAAVLADASRKTTPQAVQADPELLAQAREMPQDAFAKQARRWAARRQRDRGEADFKRLRARRSLRFWSGDDGMTYLRGVFDPVAGERIRGRLERIAARLRREDRKHAKSSSGSSIRGALSRAGGSEPAVAARRPLRSNRRGSAGSDSSRRSFEQCTADALEQLATSSTPANSSGSTSSGSGSPGGNSSSGSGSPGGSGSTSSGSGSPGGNSSGSTSNSSPGGNGCGGSVPPHPVADILVYADIAALQPDTSSLNSSGGGFAAEVAGGGPIPPSVLERLMCNARITGLLFNGPGQPLWCGRARRTASVAQLKALRLRDRGCVGCGAHPDRCQAHHITPWRQDGPTDIDNLVLVCYQCHHRIHDDGWRITTTPDCQHALRPPRPQSDTAQTQPRRGTPARTLEQAPAPRKHPPAHTTLHLRNPPRPERAQPPHRNLPLLC